MDCEERRLLVDACEVTAALYTFALEQVEDLRPTASKVKYEDLMRFLRDARQQRNVAFKDLAKHISRHKCQN
jgi:hypothetical protein